MYRNILVPLDGSQRSERILPHIKLLADRFEAKVILLQVIESHIEFSGSQTAYKDEAIEVFLRETDLADIYLSSLNDQLKAEGIHALSQVVHGDIVKTILGTAQRWDVDLIAISSHGRTGHARVFYGSVAAGVLHQVNKPLLLIRSEDNEEDRTIDRHMYGNILVPLDGSKRAENILPYVLELALRFGASVVLLRVVEFVSHNSRPKASFPRSEFENFEQRFYEAESYLSDIQGAFHEKGIQVKTIVKNGPVVKRICKVAGIEDVDLIAMASHGCTGFERFFYGSIAAGVLHQIDRPLLIIRSRDDSLE